MFKGLLKFLGSASSGNFGHAGRPGQRGGSVKGASITPDSVSEFDAVMRTKTFAPPKRMKEDIAKGKAHFVWLDAEKAEAMFQKDDAYIGEGGKKGIGDRYSRFGDFFNDNKSIEVSELSFGNGDWGERGRTSFLNGRHRFAYMRDKGATSIPAVVMTGESSLSLDELKEIGIVKSGKESGAKGSDVSPLVKGVEFYHGAASKFDKFDLSKLHSGADKGSASWYGDGVYLTGQRWKGESYAAAHGEKGRLAKVSAKLSNPFVVEGTGAGDWYAAREKAEIPVDATSKEVTRLLREKGHDGVAVLKSGSSSTVNELVVFEADKVEIQEWETKKETPKALVKHIKVNTSVDVHVEEAVVVMSVFRTLGGAGSGNFGHGGRPGEVGGSASSGLTSAATWTKRQGWRTSSGEPLPEHIAKLAPPPGWKKIHFSPDPIADLLFQGVDAKGRVQSRYSDTHTLRAAAAKFNRVSSVVSKFDSIQASFKKDLSDDTAACAALIAATGMRPGSEKDTGAESKGYGATTLLASHVKKDADGVFLKFVPGKKHGQTITMRVKDPVVAKMLTGRASSKKAGEKLFSTSPSTLSKYVREVAGCKTKDLRTAIGTMTAIETIRKMDAPSSSKEYKSQLKAVATVVSEKLGNTPTIALAAYIDPVVFSKWRKPEWSTK